MFPVNGWTGGQYSAYRLVFGSYLLVRLCALALGAATGMETALAALAVVAAVGFALGWRDRWLALLIACAWAWLFVPGGDVSVAFVGVLLLAHSALPRAPWGSWDARGRADPDGGWHMPQAIFVAAWIVLAIAYSWAGYAKLVGPPWLEGRSAASPVGVVTAAALAIELLFAPLALVRPLRPWLWLAMLGVHAGRGFGMLVVHLFIADPGWLPGRSAERRSHVLFYDGDCGLCHRTVRFLLAEDRREVFLFAPLASAAFERAAGGRGDLPDSVVLQTPEGGLLVRSAAMMHMLATLGGLWRLLAIVLRAVPEQLRDSLYDGVATVRSRLFTRPAAACPVVTPALRERFLD